jgi:hypothetical protein
MAKLRSEIMAQNDAEETMSKTWFYTVFCGCCSLYQQTVLVDTDEIDLINPCTDLQKNPNKPSKSSATDASHALTSYSEVPKQMKDDEDAFVI